MRWRTCGDGARGARGERGTAPAAAAAALAAAGRDGDTAFTAICVIISRTSLARALTTSAVLFSSPSWGRRGLRSGVAVLLDFLLGEGATLDEAGGAATSAADDDEPLPLPSSATTAAGKALRSRSATLARNSGAAPGSPQVERFVASQYQNFTLVSGSR